MTAPIGGVEKIATGIKDFFKAGDQVELPVKKQSTQGAYEITCKSCGKKAFKKVEHALFCDSKCRLKDFRAKKKLQEG